MHSSLIRGFLLGFSRMLSTRFSTILPVVLGNDTTSRMNFCTWDGLFCLYPNLTAERIALTTSDSVIVSESTYLNHRKRGIQLFDDTMSWMVLCGDECASIWRRIRGGRGIGKFAWTQCKTEIGLLDTLAVPTFRYKWRLRSSCDDPCCPNNPEYHHV